MGVFKELTAKIMLIIRLKNIKYVCTVWKECENSTSKPGLEHKKTQDMFATSGYAKLSHNTKSISHKRKVDKLE